MKINVENLALCQDCTIVAVNGDYSSLDYHYNEQEAAERVTAIDTGLDKLSKLGHLCHSGLDYDEFSWRTCDCCGSRLGGQRDFFHTLVEE